MQLWLADSAVVQAGGVSAHWLLPGQALEQEHHQPGLQLTDHSSSGAGLMYYTKAQKIHVLTYVYYRLIPGGVVDILY
jgi:hypothetical protein